MDFFEFARNMKAYTAAQFIDDLQVALEADQNVKQLQIQQWNEGVDDKGNILGRYSKATEILSGGLKKAGETFDIFQTGETRRKLELFASQEGGDLSFFFDSDSKQVPELLERIGSRLFGLNGKSLNQFIPIAQDTAIKLLNQNLKL